MAETRGNAQDRPAELLARARAGDSDARNRLIADFTPFVLKVASRKAGRYLRPGSDDEVSVALMAFNEAIDAFEPERGSFISFSETVIQRRLVDYFRRSQAQQRRELFLSDLDNEDHPSSSLDTVSQKVWGVLQEEEERRLEIAEYASVLARFHITWDELARIAPKHRDARDRAIRLAQSTLREPVDRLQLVEEGALPERRLIEEFGISRRLIERHRRYILAVALMLAHDLPHLHEYVLHRGR